MAPPILLIGAGRMGGALLKGWIARGIGPVVAVEPAPSAALKTLAKKHGVTVRASADGIDTARACIVALKPQVLKGQAAALKPVAQSGALMLSIAAGTSIRAMRAAWGRDARVVRAMPNTPGSIGRGITALFAGAGTLPKDKTLAEQLLAALGETVWVRREADIDAVTAVSGSGPAYVFLLVEALADAAVAEGLARPLADRLARATITGAGALLDAGPAAPAELRRAVTSPHGTTEAALKVLMGRSGLTPLLRRAVAAARKRARELGG
ncbi:MAG: pyrroline-5-carboxylate reductase [Rhizomicrobium sp.]